MAAPPRLEAHWAAAFNAAAAPDPALHNGSQYAARSVAPSLPPAFPMPNADAAARLRFEQLRHEANGAAGFTNGAMMAGRQQMNQEQQWRNGQQTGLLHAMKGNYQQQPQRQEQQQHTLQVQQQYQLQPPTQVSAPPANTNASTNSQSGNGGGAYRSSAVIQPGVAIVPQHYLPVPVEMPVLRPPTYPLPFVDSYSYTHSGFQLQSPQGRERYGSQPRFFGSQQQQPSMASSYGSTAATGHLATPMTATHPQIAFVPFSAQFDNVKSTNSNNYAASNQFGNATWNREQHFSAAASTIDPRFSREALQQRQQHTALPLMLLNQRYGNGWVPHTNTFHQQQRQQQESQSAYFDAAATLYNLQSPVFSPRHAGEGITMESLLNNDGKTTQNAAKPKPKKPKASKKTQDVDAKGVELLLSMSVEQQHRALSVAGNTEIEADFLESLSRPQSSLAFAPPGSNQRDFPAAQLQEQLQKQEQQQQQKASFPPYQIRPGMAIDAVPLSGVNAAANAQINLSNDNVGVKQKKAPVKRRRKQDVVQERILYNPTALATSTPINTQSSASQAQALSMVSVTKRNSTQGIAQPTNSGRVGAYSDPVSHVSSNNSNGHNTTSGEVKKAKAPVKRKRKQQVVSADAESVVQQPPGSTLYKRTTSGQSNLSPGFHMVWTLPDAQLTNLLNSAASSASTSSSMAINRVTHASNTIRDAQHRQLVQPATAIGGGASNAANPSTQLVPSHPNGTNGAQPLKKPGPQQKKRSSAKGISVVKPNEEAKYICATLNNGSHAQIPIKPDASRDQVSAAQGVAASASREQIDAVQRPMVSATLHVQLQQPPAMHDTGGMLVPAGVSQQKPKLPTTSNKKSTNVSQAAKELALNTAVLEVPEPPVAADAVSYENSTVMIFCKRDFMRYQAVKLWKKFQEKKKKLEFKSTQVSGKRTRYHSARYGSQTGVTQPKPKKEKKLPSSKKTSSKESVESTQPSKENALAEETKRSENERIPPQDDQLPDAQPPQSSEASSDDVNEHLSDAQPLQPSQLLASSEHVSVEKNKEAASSADERIQHENDSEAPPSRKPENSIVTSEGTKPASSAASAPQ
ncbi:hypothetical protein FI667_g5106, partial [Globisporangium splendens]